jgi:hypothetical protein
MRCYKPEDEHDSLFLITTRRILWLRLVTFLYGYQSLSVTQILMFGNRVLMVFASKREGIAGEPKNCAVRNFRYVLLADINFS